MFGKGGTDSFVYPRKCAEQYKTSSAWQNGKIAEDSFSDEASLTGFGILDTGKGF
jgi:hypothetical protein